MAAGIKVLVIGEEEIKCERNDQKIGKKNKYDKEN